MAMIVVAPPTEEEIRQYKEEKGKARIEALSDLEKQTFKNAKAIVQVGKIRVGLCPTCGHCLKWGGI